MAVEKEPVWISRIEKGVIRWEQENEAYTGLLHFSHDRRVCGVACK
jgi:hypothetical protein